VTDYRLALRSVPEWDDEHRMDDIVVNDVRCFRMEQMSARSWWLQCYLDDDPAGDYITFNIRFNWKTREIECHVTEYPDGDHTIEVGR
jgi:hypothetical protein